MTKRELEQLAHNRQWTMLLKCIDEGATTIAMPDVAAIKSLKSVAYDMNTDGISPFVFTFTVDKSTPSITITASKR